MIKLGDMLYNDIENNEYLHELYRRVVEEYSFSLFNENYITSLTEKQKMDALRFADILSKCTIEAKRDYLYNLAQHLVTMLNKIYPDDELVKYYLGAVLSNVNNYFGLQNNCSEYINDDIVECVKEFLDKETFKIPGETETYFINKQKVAYEYLKRCDCYSFSAPTSLGKTFVIRTFIKDCVESGEKSNFVIVVPTNALINEVYNRVIEDLKDKLWSNGYKVVKSPAAISEDDEYNYIMVYTQERFLVHLLKFKSISINYLFIDEAHKISVSESRSAFFYKIMNFINKDHSAAKVYFSSPNIPNPQVYLELTSDSLNSAYTRIKYSPVNQNKLIFDKKNNKIWYYSEIDKKFFELNCAGNTISINRDILELVAYLGKEKNNIVFCSTKKEAVNWANKFAESQDVIVSKELDELIMEISEEIHEACYLTQTLKKGIAYHVAYLPTNIKERIELLFKKRVIRTIFCTSTLLEGVNFPADNLFMMLPADSIWLEDKARVDFKNLTGRVGRIEYNMFGNIFLISETDTVEKYKTAVKEEVNEQKLSIEYYLAETKKKEIIEALIKGSTIIEEKKMTYDEYNFARYALNMLLKDIINGTKSKLYRLFDKYLSEENISKIREHFAENHYVQDDISTTADQIEAVDKELNLSQITYPDAINYRNVFGFLQKLHKLFSWDKYESKNDIGNINCLKYFAVILQQWMLGFGMKQIIEETIDYHRRKGEIYIARETVPYDDSIEQKNYLINEILDHLERTIQFKIKNYFLKFSERKIANGQELVNGDWFEFVEYGTCNMSVILLQKIGFSRENAIYVNREHRDKFKITDGKIVSLKKSLLKCRKVLGEVVQIQYNHHNLFID